MALNFTDQDILASNSDFITRVRQAIATTALAIASEAATVKPGVDTLRLSYANLVLRDPERHARVMVHGVVTSMTKNDVTDAELSNIVAAIWNAYAGVNPNLVA